MTTEEKLREIILNRYHSIREFSSRIGVPNSTVESILKRGVANSSVSNVIKLCKGLNLDVEALAEGRIEYVKTKNPIASHVKVIRVSEGKVNVVPVPKRDEDVRVILNGTIKQLTDATKLTLNGKTIDTYDVDSIVDAMNFGVDIVSKRQTETD